MSVHRVPVKDGEAWEVRYREDGRNRSQRFEDEEGAIEFDEEVKQARRVARAKARRPKTHGYVEPERFKTVVTILLDQMTAEQLDAVAERFNELGMDEQLNLVPRIFYLQLSIDAVERAEVLRAD
jgi:hypothetical protein